MKKTLINTVTAKALAGQIISEFNAKANERRAKKVAEIKANPMYKRYKALISKIQEYEFKATPLRKELEKKYSAYISREDISIDSAICKIRVNRDALADEIIVLHNVNGKSIESIKKELTEKYSK